MKLDIEVSRLGLSDILILTCYYEGESYKIRYAGYSITEAKKRFRAYVKEEQSKVFYNIVK